MNVVSGILNIVFIWLLLMLCVIGNISKISIVIDIK